jgi:GT2 family glycosyltransferase
MSGEGPLRPPAAGVSVVIPTHDTRELVLACLASLAAADPPPREIVVVDDGSSDGTAAAVEASYPAVRLLRHAAPRGFTAAANAGAALATSELLLLLNSDTAVERGAVGALAAAFAAAPRLGVAGAALTYPDGRAQWSGGRAPRPLWLLALASGLPRRLDELGRWPRRPVSGHRGEAVEWVTGAALATRRSLWQSLDGLDPRFALYAQDLDFCLRAGAAGWQVAIVPACRVVHHHGATIGRQVAGRQHTPLLWADLVRWARKQGGGAGARRAARRYRLGGALQRALLRLAALRGGAAAARARRESATFRAAAAAARAAAHEAGPPAPIASAGPLAGGGRT